MKQFLKKGISGFVTLSTAFSLTGLGLVSTAFAAGQLTSVSATLTDVRSTQGSDATVQFSVKNTTNVKAIQLQWRVAPSGTGTVPSGFSNAAAGLSGTDVVTVAGTAQHSWAIANGTPGQVTITNAAGTDALVQGNVISVGVTSLTNNTSTISGAGECDSIANSDTCYIIVSTYSSDTVFDSGTLVDQGVASYTVITPTTVTATVDPQLVFTVAGVTSAANIQTNDSNAGCASSADVTATSTTIPFGNIRVNVPKCGQQSLTVQTNSQNGYMVYQKFVGTTAATDLMQGTNTSNNFDAFTAGGATWGAPAVWASPTGSANVDSGYVGARVKNPGTMSPGVSGFGSANFYAPPYVGTGIGNKVMDKSTTDNGSSPTFVTYKIQVGASQPVDTYTGSLVYNVVATY